ncbi:prepilin-type N-terminal cleavage/methylation domain-containing protein, partial [Candidatus Saccharibacteria bacterium]|nr:prepilin-type N-terminal cleavage/methylation domain-containing protein [Candidatus Saccharibacteria bacterium]
MWAKNKQPGFTIVELLIVIVVIGILAAITIVAYNGVQQRAVVASLTSDLDNGSKTLKLFQVDNGSYPTTINCAIADSSVNKCVKASSGTTYQYTVSNTNPQSFCISATNNTQNYSIGQDAAPLAGPCPVSNLDAGSSVSYPGTGSNWIDLSGNGNNGTIVGGVSYSAANGGALTFDGTSGYVRTAVIPAYGSFALSLWFKTPAPRDGDRLYWGYNTDRAILANSGTAGALTWYVNTSVTNTGYKYTSSSTVVNQWNNVVLQYTGSQVQLFINGVQDSVTANITGTSNASAFNLGTNYNN